VARLNSSYYYYAGVVSLTASWLWRGQMADEQRLTTYYHQLVASSTKQPNDYICNIACCHVVYHSPAIYFQPNILQTSAHSNSSVGTQKGRNHLCLEWFPPAQQVMATRCWVVGDTYEKHHQCYDATISSYINISIYKYAPTSWRTFLESNMTIRPPHGAMYILSVAVPPTKSVGLAFM
jgi:hypothetical protein